MDKVTEDGGGISPTPAEVPVEVFREDSAYQTPQQRKDIITAVVDAEGATGDQLGCALWP